MIASRNGFMVVRSCNSPQEQDGAGSSAPPPKALIHLSRAWGGSDESKLERDVRAGLVLATEVDWLPKQLGHGVYAQPWSNTTAKLSFQWPGQ